MSKFLIVKETNGAYEKVEKFNACHYLPQMIMDGHFRPSKSWLPNKLIRKETPIKGDELPEFTSLIKLDKSLFAIVATPDENKTSDFYTLGVRAKGSNPLEQTVVKTKEMTRESLAAIFSNWQEKYSGDEVDFEVEAGVPFYSAPSLFLNVDEKAQMKQEFGEQYQSKQTKSDTLIASLNNCADDKVVKENMGKLFVVFPYQSLQEHDLWLGNKVKNKDFFKQIASHLEIKDATEEQYLVQVVDKKTPELINALASEQAFRFAMSEICVAR